MEKVYRRKWLISIIMLISLSIFNLSCSLIESPEEEGSLAFTLPSFTSSRAACPSSQGDNPSSYLVTLLIGNNNNYKGKIIEKYYNPGENVVIKGLKPNTYTLIIRAESNKYIYEGSVPVTITLGKNTVDIKLTKIKKGEIILDLSSLNLPSSSTFSYVVYDEYGREVYKETEVSYKPNYTISYGFKTGSYSIDFTTTNSDNEKYIIDNEGIVSIKKSNIGTPITLAITSTPRTTLYVRSGSINGNGSEKAPFDSIQKALAIISSNVSNIENQIIIDGKIIENEDILINNNKKVELKGKTNDGTCGIEGLIIIDNASVTLCDLFVSKVSGGTVDFRNGTLTLGSSTHKAPYISSLKSNGTTPITVNNAMIPYSKNTSHLVLDSYTEGKDIFTSSNAEYIKHYLLDNNNFYITPEGKLANNPRGKIKLAIDGFPSGKTYKVKVSENASPNKEIGLYDIPSIGGILTDCSVEIGTEYKLEFLDVSPSSSVSLGTKLLTINEDTNKNVVSFAFINELFVDAYIGNDYYSGHSQTAPLATVSKAISVIQDKKALNGNNNYIIHVNGSVIDKDITISDSLNIAFKGNETQKDELIASITVNSATLNVDDMAISKVDLQSGSLNLNGDKGSINTAKVRTILLSDGLKVNVNGELSESNEKMTIVYSTYAKGTSVVNYSTEVVSRPVLFVGQQQGIIVNNNGTFDNSSFKVNLSTAPKANKYLYKIYNDAKDTQLAQGYITSQSFVPNYLFTNEQRYVLNIFDTEDYNSLVAEEEFTFPIENLDICLDYTYYVSNTGDDSLNNGLEETSSYKTLAKAFASINTRVASNNPIAKGKTFTILLDPSGSVDFDGETTINSEVNIVIDGNGGQGKLKTSVTQIPLTLDNPTTKVIFKNVLMENVAHSSKINGILKIVHGDVTFDEGFVDELSTRDDDDFIVLQDQSADAIVHLKDCMYVPRGNIKLNKNNKIIIADDFYNKYKHNNVKPVKTYCESTLLEGDKVLETESGRALGNQIFAFQEKSEIVSNSNLLKRTILSDGTIGHTRLSNYNFLDANSAQPIQSSLAALGLTVCISPKDENIVYERTIKDLTEKFWFNIGCDYDVAIKKNATEILCFNEYASSTNEVSSNNINLFCYYFGDEFGYGQQIYTNNGQFWDRPMSIHRAYEKIKCSGDLPSLLINPGNYNGANDNIACDRKPLIIDGTDTLNLTIKNKYEQMYFSNTITLDPTDSSDGLKTVPTVIIDNPNANVTIKDMCLTPKYEPEKNEAVIVVKQGTVNLEHLIFGGDNTERNRNLIIAESPTTINIYGNYDMYGSERNFIALNNTNGTLPIINVPKDINDLDTSNPVEFRIKILRNGVEYNDFASLEGKKIINATTNISKNVAFFKLYKGKKESTTHQIDSNGILVRK